MGPAFPLARGRIEAARGAKRDNESLVAWLEALTDYSFALTNMQEYASESVHEKLHEVGGRIGTSFERSPTPLPPGEI